MKDFGAFVEILPGTDGMVHISQLDSERVEKVEDIADIALNAERPPNFNDQCAAFIASDIKNAIHEGVAHEDIVAGLVFFGGLRWTLSRVETARRPVVLVISSLLIRMAVVAGALVVFSDGRLARVLAGLGGLLAVRTVLVSATRRELATMEATSWT